ncbi:MAG TPA: hypothetical protein VM888_04010, partial [Chitinophagaceae bacterium]|nr:hypothetical protein [Chitinophagaceae bacterium]
MQEQKPRSSQAKDILVNLKPELNFTLNASKSNLNKMKAKISFIFLLLLIFIQYAKAQKEGT